MYVCTYTQEQYYMRKNCEFKNGNRDPEKVNKVKLDVGQYLKIRASAGFYEIPILTEEWLAMILTVKIGIS